MPEFPLCEPSSSIGERAAFAARESDPAIIERMGSDERLARERLARVIETHGGVTATASAAGLHKSYISELRAGNKPFGIAARRRLEEALHLPRGWFSGEEAAPTALLQVPLKTWEAAELKATPNTARITTALPVTAEGYALLMDSDAMMSPSLAERSIPPGVLVIIDPAAQCKSGDDAVVVLAKGARPCIRRVVDDGPFRFLRPANAAYGGLVRMRGDVRIIGRVVGMQASF